MSKLLIKINNKDDLKYPANGYILGVKNYCICFEESYAVSDILNIKNSLVDKKIFACLNKPIFNSELKSYKNILKELDKMNLDGIIVGDVAALTYNLNTNIILDQLHLINSYYTVNHYLKNNVSGIYLTNDITSYEINEIKNNSSALLFKQVFGNVHLSSSVRNLVTNYLDYFNIDKNDNINYIKEEKSNKYYKIIEDDFGTHIFNSKKLNLLDKIDEINANYIVIDTYLLNRDNLDLVVNSFINLDTSYKEKIDELYDCDDGFIYKQTIYKVKNDE